jgi:Ca-activated chloride channel family protein
MTLLSPSRLWLLIGVVVLAAAYVVLQRRRRHPAVRHPDLDLVRSVAPRRAGWRRHVAAVGLLATTAALVVGLARPAHSVEVPRDEAVVMLAVDVSGSMTATDVVPTRLEAAVAAARQFVADAPAAYRIGLVAFDDGGHVLAPPTTDRTTVLDALARLERGPGTAAGEGLYVALDQISTALADDGGVIAADQPYAAVVLLADGANTIGRPLDEAATAAADEGIPVFTIAFGTDAGVVDVDGVPTRVPADPDAMAMVADTTGGTTYTATTGGELADVYSRIGTHIGTDVEQIELTMPLAAAAGALLALALGAAALWSPRLV